MFPSIDRERHRKAATVIVNMNDRLDEGDEGESLRSPSSSTSEYSASSTVLVRSRSSRMKTMEEFKTSEGSIDIPDETRADRLRYSQGEENDEIAALQLKIRTMELEHKAELSKYKDALVMAVSDLGKIDIVRSMTISNLRNTDLILEGRQRLEQFKAQLLVIQEENLNLEGRLERAMIQINSFDAERKITAELEEENKRMRIQLRQYENLMTNARKTKPGAVTVRSSSRPPNSTSKRP